MKELWMDNYRLGRTRGKFNRIRNAGRRWLKEYNISTSDMLRVKPRRYNLDLLQDAIPANEWKKYFLSSN